MKDEFLTFLLLAKKAPSKPVESIKPRYRSDFEEFQKLLTNLILEQKVNKTETFGRD